MKKQNVSEKVFANYLKDIGIKFEYEPCCGVDYRAQLGNFREIDFQVKEFRISSGSTRERQEREAGFCDGYAYNDIQNKISNSTNKYNKHKENSSRPFVCVVQDFPCTSGFSEVELKEALYGLESLVPNSTSPRAQYKMIHDNKSALVRQGRNTTLSALVSIDQQKETVTVVGNIYARNPLYTCDFSPRQSWQIVFSDVEERSC